MTALSDLIARYTQRADSEEPNLSGRVTVRLAPEAWTALTYVAGITDQTVSRTAGHLLTAAAIDAAAAIEKSRPDPEETE